MWNDLILYVKEAVCKPWNQENELGGGDSEAIAIPFQYICISNINDNAETTKRWNETKEYQIIELYKNVTLCMYVCNNFF